MSQATFVLIHGSWSGGWCWRRVLSRLRAAGFEAHAPTLTGVGERAHLLRSDIRLATHINDVLGVIRAEELHDVVLVGHSYAGMVITGVADWLRQQQLPSPRAMVYLDAVTPHTGESWSSQHKAETVAQRLASGERSGGLSFDPPDSALFGLEGADRDWVNRRQTPQPLGLYQDPLHFDADHLAGLPRVFIDCNQPALATIDVMRQRVRREPGWQVLEMATGHYPMLSAPEALSELLLSIARAH